MKNTGNSKLPWQFNTTGIVLGFFFGIIPTIIALSANYQFKQGLNVEDLRKAYNIIFILFLVLIILFILFNFFIMLIRPA